MPRGVRIINACLTQFTATHIQIKLRLNKIRVIIIRNKSTLSDEPLTKASEIQIQEATHKNAPPKRMKVKAWRARVKRSSFSGSVIFRGLPKVIKQYQQNRINAIMIHGRK